LDRFSKTSGLGDFTSPTHTSPKWVVGSHRVGGRLPPLNRKSPAVKKNFSFQRAGVFSQVPRFVDNPHGGQFTRQFIPCSLPSSRGTDPYGCTDSIVTGKAWLLRNRALCTASASRSFPPHLPATDIDAYGIVERRQEAWASPSRTSEIADTIASPKRTIFQAVPGKLLAQNPNVSIRINC